MHNETRLILEYVTNQSPKMPWMHLRRVAEHHYHLHYWGPLVAKMLNRFCQKLYFSLPAESRDVLMQSADSGDDGITYYAEDDNLALCISDALGHYMNSYWYKAHQEFLSPLIFDADMKQITEEDIEMILKNMAQEAQVETGSVQLKLF